MNLAHVGKFRVPIVSALLFLGSVSAFGQSQPFITSSVPAATRNNYTGFVGMKFTVGSSAISVTSLGRLYRYGFGMHQVKLVDAHTSLDVPGASVEISSPGSATSNSFEYADLASPVSLPANGVYFLVSQETAGQDFWNDYAPVTTSTAAAVNAAVYTAADGSYVQVPGSTGESYVPVNFQYVLGSVGNSPLTVSVTSPTNGQVLAISSSYATTSATFSANASGPLGIKTVQFQIDNENFGTPVTTMPFSLSIQVNGLTNGIHFVTAVATDSASNKAVSAPVSISVTGSGATYFINGQNPGALRNNYGDLYAHFVGMKFTTGSSGVMAYQLGRFAAPGNMQTHLLKLIYASTGIDVANGSIAVDMSHSTPGQYVYGFLSQPVVLTANTAYYLVSKETIGGDQWYDIGPVSAGTAFGAVNGPVYQTPEGTYVTVPQLANNAYVPVNLGYVPLTSGISNGLYVFIGSPASGSTIAGTTTIAVGAQASLSNQGPPITSVQLSVDGTPVGAPITTRDSYYGYFDVPLDTTKLPNGPHTVTATATDAAANTGTTSGFPITVNNVLVSPTSSPLVTAFTPTTLRNNFSGFLGLQFTVGAGSLPVTSLGRICVAGNAGTHTVKLVQVSDGMDVPGGNVSVAMTGCMDGQFVYAPLANAITLPPGASFYLVDLETAGGDKWFDYAAVIASGLGTVNGPVYWDGTQYVKVNSPSSSFVPLNLLSGSTGNGFSITIVPPTPFFAPVFLPPGSPISLSIGSTITAVPSRPAPIQFYLDGHYFDTLKLNPPYTLTLPALNFGIHTVSAMAPTSGGVPLASLPVSFSFGTQSNVYPQFEVPLIQFTPSTSRNNYSGWVGFRFTTGASGTFTQPSTYGPAVGRVCVSGNSMPHLVKIVRASDGGDVPGANAWLNMAGCTVGQTVIAPLPGSVLTPYTSYYLVSQEVSGGDQWFDTSSAMPILNAAGGNNVPVNPAFTIDGPVYFDGAGYVFLPTPNVSFVGLILYGLTSPI